MTSFSKKLSVLMVAVLAVGLGVPLAAQDNQGETAGPKDKMLTESNELFQAIAEKTQEFDRIQAEIEAATGEDKEALQKIAAELIIDYVKDVHLLSANVMAREEEGQDVGDDREKVTEMFEQISGFFRTTVDEMKAKLAELRKERSEAPPEELSQIEDRLVTLNQRLEDALGILLEEIEKREAFGLESTTERKFLSEALADRAELLTGRIELARENELSLQKRVEADAENAELRTELDLTRQRLDLYIGRLTATVGQMDTLGLDTAEYQQLLFEVTGEITTGILSREVLAGIVASWWENALDWLKNNGPRIFFKTLLFLLILLVFRILSRIARKIVRKAIRTSNLKVSQLLERTALSVTGAVVMIFGLLVALSQLGVEVAPLLAGLGVAGFIVGFALQDTLANFASGIMILLYRPYDVGDLIEVGGAFGKVNDMTLVATTILTLDHQTLVIPNNKIWGDVIKNVTAQKIRRIDMVFGISYSDDIPHAEKVLEEILESHDGVLESPEPVVKLHNLGDSSVDFIVRPWVKTDDYWDVYWHVTREVKMRFDAEGISIPFPQRDVHVIQEGPADQA